MTASTRPRRALVRKQNGAWTVALEHEGLLVLDLPWASYTSALEAALRWTHQL